jgi:L-histidine N-alpha-methyltransferase
MIAEAPVECIVELGAGSAKKTMHLLREQVRQRKQGIFAPIDVSLPALSMSRDTLRLEFPELVFQGLHARFEDGIASIEKERPTLFVFLGSTLGNFTRSEFVRFFDFLSGCMGPDDFLLLGVDHVKDIPILERAYNDSQGVTADFILNVFYNVNRTLQSNFDVGHMRYHSWYNSKWQQIEMYVISTRSQDIHCPAHETSFLWEEGDAILVEISRKFEPAKLQKQFGCFGFDLVKSFADAKAWFSLLLFRKSHFSTAQPCATPA